MNTRIFSLVLSCAFSLVPCAALAASLPLPLPYSSSLPAANLPDAPSASLFGEGSNSIIRGQGRQSHLTLQTRPFSALAMQINLGSGGLGVELATPLASKMNLRAGITFLDYNPSLVADGFPITGAVKFRTISAGVDIFPFRNSFHITPGVTMYNGNHAGATTFIPSGQTFTVNDTDYVSGWTQPVSGQFDVSFGKKYAPSLTFGFGNMLRPDSHWSIPTEFGFEYIGRPVFTLNMQGMICSPADCNDINKDPESVADLKQEQATVNNDIAILRFYPILKVGLSYRFGRNKNMSYWH